MSKSTQEIAAELTAVAMSSGVLKHKVEGGTNVGAEIASMYRKIHEAVASASRKDAKKK